MAHSRKLGFVNKGWEKKMAKFYMDKLKVNEPCLILMNHSSFIDLEILANILHDRSYNIVATSDSFVGIMKWVMRLIGCIPTKKFITDMNLIRDMLYCVKELKSTVVMFPEASYSFDGTATPLPDSIGRCDLYSASNSEMKKTIEKFKSFKDDYALFPGHGDATMLSEEKKNNVYFGE